MSKNISLKKVLYILLPIMALCVVALLLLYSSASQNQSAKPNGPSFAELLDDYEPKEPEKNGYTVLLLGYGGAGHSGGGLADAQILTHIDTKTQKTTFIAIPRDSWVKLPVRSDQDQYHKINMAFAIGASATIEPLKDSLYSGSHGGGILAKVAAEKVTGLEVDYYAAIDFDRFERAIDALGGISIDVPVAFDDRFYPVKGLENETCGFSPEEIEKFHQDYSGFELEKQFTCRYEHLHFAKGKNEMDGATALKFIRSRHSDQHGGDFARGQRQQALLVAIKDKLLSLEALDNIDEFYEEYRHMITTDIDQNVILELLPKIGNPKEYSVTNLNITTDNFLQSATSSDGQYILVPKAGQDNWSQVHDYISDSL